MTDNLGNENHAGFSHAPGSAGNASSTFKDVCDIADEPPYRTVRDMFELMERDLLDRMEGVEGGDPRWRAIARTQLQQGFMALYRSLPDNEI
jgi:hypothetical protein